MKFYVVVSWYTQGLQSRGRQVPSQTYKIDGCDARNAFKAAIGLDAPESLPVGGSAKIDLEFPIVNGKHASSEKLDYDGPALYSRENWSLAKVKVYKTYDSD